MNEFTFTGGPAFLKGQRLYMHDHRLLVTRVNSPTSFTAVLRDAWYWRVQWRILDACEAIGRAVGGFLLASE